MALRPLSKITVHSTKGKDHLFYVNMLNLSRGEESFLDSIFPAFPGGVKLASSERKTYDFVLPGYYEDEDIAAVRDALAKSIVREVPAPAKVT